MSDWDSSADSAIIGKNSTITNWIRIGMEIRFLFKRAIIMIGPRTIEVSSFGYQKPLGLGLFHLFTAKYGS